MVERLTITGTVERSGLVRPESLISSLRMRFNLLEVELDDPSIGWAVDTRAEERFIVEAIRGYLVRVEVVPFLMEVTWSKEEDGR